MKGAGEEKAAVRKPPPRLTPQLTWQAPAYKPARRTIRSSVTSSQTSSVKLTKGRPPNEGLYFLKYGGVYFHFTKPEKEMKMEKKYGSVKTESGKLTGYTLEELTTIVTEIMTRQEGTDDYFGDLAVTPTVILDLVGEITSLRSKLEAIQLEIFLAQQTI